MLNEENLSPSLKLSCTTEAMKEKPALVAAVTGWEFVDGHDEYRIVVSYFRRLADTEAPAAAIEEDAKPVVVSQSQHRFSSFLALHEEIGEALGMPLWSSIPRPADQPAAAAALPQPNLLLKRARPTPATGVQLTATKNLLAGLDFVKEERVAKLGAYLNAALLSAQFGEQQPVPGLPVALCDFVGIEEAKLKEVAGDAIKIAAKAADPAAAEPATPAKPKRIFTSLPASLTKCVKSVSTPMKSPTKPAEGDDAKPKPKRSIVSSLGAVLCVSPREPSRRAMTIKEMQSGGVQTPEKGAVTPVVSEPSSAASSAIERSLEVS